MEYVGLIAVILVCGLFADNLNTKTKVKELEERIRDLERLGRDKPPGG